MYRNIDLSHTQCECGVPLVLPSEQEKGECVICELKKMKDKVITDQVKHPRGYTQGSIECWDYIADKKLNFLEGNVVKYITRYRHKNGLEDLKKAKQYLDKLIEVEYPDGK